MCSYAYYTHPVCHCRWLRIIHRCGPNLGFSTCPSLLDGSAKLAPPSYRARLPWWFLDNETRVVVSPVPITSACPQHDLHGVYDRNDVRLILEVQRGMRWGAGPNPADYGVEGYCSMM